MKGSGTFHDPVPIQGLFGGMAGLPFGLCTVRIVAPHLPRFLPAVHVLCLAHIRSVVWFGLLSSLAIALALVTDLVVVPALLAGGEHVRDRIGRLRIRGMSLGMSLRPAACRRM